MSAIKGKRYINTDRTRLEEVIPLDTPFLVYIDPSSVCNFRCNFCPCGIKNKKNWSKDKKISIMKYDFFVKIIDDLKEFPRKIKTLRLYKEGEPLLNKDLPKMICYAKQSNIAERIDFTTNASLLTPELSLELISAGVDRINISIEALDVDGYKETSGVDIDMQKFLENIQYLYDNREKCHILIKISDYGLQGHSEEEFYGIFSKMCDEIAIENVAPVWPEFDLHNIQDNFDKGLHGNEVRECLVCPYIFYSLCINSTGTVSACLMDWNHKLLVGDVSTHSVKEVWNSEKINEMRKYNLQGKRKEMDTCSGCGQMTYATLDNIDSYKDALLKRMF